MIVSIDKNYLFNIFGVNNFSSLETIIDSMAPSLVEYHLSSFCEDNSDTIYFNKRDVLAGDYTLYLDYSENLYLELIESDIDEMTQSFW